MPPVLDHEVHELMSIQDTKPYGCYNNDRDQQAYSAPNRRAGSDGHNPIFWIERVRVKNRMSRECRYDMSLKDLRCSGCKHRGSGEAYDAAIRGHGS